MSPSALAAGAAADAARTVRSRGDAGREWAALLAEVPLFTGLSKRHLRRVASLAQTRRFEAGAIVVRSGDPGDGFYVVLDGEAVVRRRSGGPVRLRAGDFFGELALLDDGPRSATVEAGTEVLTMRIPRAGFARLLTQEPDVARGILVALAGRIRRLEED
jgi:CRP-like cAMP-binding protein